MAICNKQAENTFYLCSSVWFGDLQAEKKFEIMTQMTLLRPGVVRQHMDKYLTLKSASHDNWCTVGGDGGCRVDEVRAGTTSPMPDHKVLSYST